MRINEIVGHSDKIEHMIKAHNRGRLAHAYIFHGPGGIGKKAVAMALIKYIFCENSSYKDINKDSCSLCASCRKLESGNHPDLILVKPERSVIKIGMIRELQKKLHYGKYEAKLRFCIIDDAENLRKEAANALLKTLEEPSDDVIIILVTSKLNILLPTIISRCQKLRFNPLGMDVIKSELIRRHALKDDEADVISAFLQGSFAKMVSEDLNEIIQLRRRLVDKVKEVSLNNIADIVNFSSEIGGEDKETLVGAVEVIKTFYRDAVMIKNGIRDNLINRDIKSDINKIALETTCDGLFNKINIMNQIQGLLMANVNKKLAIESMLIKLCA
jgi:DNA polymerase-3 subunit delta'